MLTAKPYSRYRVTRGQWHWQEIVKAIGLHSNDGHTVSSDAIPAGLKRAFNLAAKFLGGLRVGRRWYVGLGLWALLALTPPRGAHLMCQGVPGAQKAWLKLPPYSA